MFTLHASFYPVDELVGLAAVQKSSDGWKRVQDYSFRVGINVVLMKRIEKKSELKGFNAFFYIVYVRYLITSQPRPTYKI